jgi:hypothetical protein
MEYLSLNVPYSCAFAWVRSIAPLKGNSLRVSCGGGSWSILYANNQNKKDNNET